MDFSGINKSSSDSFHQQKNMIKQVLAGKSVPCLKCKKPLKVETIETGLHLFCAAGCTDVKLDT